ncbi:isopenicillin N synthase family dioxygenase [Pseudonocardia oroxyli]|uniref:Isopenicillin N synthase n=1 Tax=Pseudonocardia oroxyli TaxID=366584 RepID=A0A1G7SNY8_PSEOR|nr:2-oxoglutarate and iron-dependent oxygenase domain-containing protein [Pseudonocardia oroxyli]SDG24743.1 Isopenicillin N synthase [Pseudonocardia oroxyli]
MAAHGPVPLIDLSGFDTDPTRRGEIVDGVRTACEEIGFFLVAGHGVDEQLIDSLYSDAKAFFDLPLEEKMAVRRPHAGVSRGYFTVGQQSIAAAMGTGTTTDLLEALTFGPMGPFAEPTGSADDHIHFAPNRWPQTPATLQRRVEEYYAAMRGLAATIMRVFALALDLDEQHFADKTDRSPSNLRFNHYPEQERDPEPGQLRAAEHTDYGTLTILKVEDAPGGLEVRDRAGVWHAVGSVPGAFVVNIGDAMARWTNGRWVSTVHRVVNPSRDETIGSRRLSVPFFHSANHDTVIEAIPTCVAAGATPEFAPIAAGEYWRMKNDASMAPAGRAS